MYLRHSIVTRQLENLFKKTLKPIATTIKLAKYFLQNLCV